MTWRGKALLGAVVWVVAAPLVVAAQCLPAFRFETFCGPFPAPNNWIPRQEAVCPGEPIVCRSILHNESECPVDVLLYYMEIAQFPGERETRSGDFIWFSWGGSFLDDYRAGPGELSSWATTEVFADGGVLVQVPLEATAEDAARGFKHLVMHHAAAAADAPAHTEPANDTVEACGLALACHVDIPVDIPVRNDCFASSTTTTTVTTTSTTTTLPTALGCQFRGCVLTVAGRVRCDVGAVLACTGGVRARGCLVTVEGCE